MPKTKKSSKAKKLSYTKARFNRTGLVATILLFAVVGVWFILKSFAASGVVQVNAPVVAVGQAGANDKYWIATKDGGIFTMGGAPFYGSMGGHSLAQPVTSMATRPQHDGYWLLGGDGGVYAFGAAKYNGRPAATSVSNFFRSIVATPSGNGYWVISEYGHIAAYGDATTYSAHGTNSINASLVKHNTAYGGLPNIVSNSHYITSAAASASGYGLALLGNDGAVYAYGDMPYHGGPNSGDIMNFAGGNRATTIIANSGNGYVIATSSGAAYAYGGAAYLGGGSVHTVGGAYTPDQKGYWLVASDGSVYAQGNAQYQGRVQAPTPTPPPPTTSPTTSTSSQPSSTSGTSPTSTGGTNPCIALVPTNIKQLQSCLNYKGATPPLVVDGILGDKTRQACATVLAGYCPYPPNSGSTKTGGGNSSGNGQPPVNYCMPSIQKFIEAQSTYSDLITLYNNAAAQPKRNSDPDHKYGNALNAMANKLTDMANYGHLNLLGGGCLKAVSEGDYTKFNQAFGAFVLGAEYVQAYFVKL